MISQNPKSITMFTDDFRQTYSRIATRTQEMIAEEEASGSASGEREQIQLVAEDPNMTISFNLPDGPPPDDIRIEGEGAEELDMEQVRGRFRFPLDRLMRLGVMPACPGCGFNFQVLEE
jgi:cell division cycle protein 37